MRHPLLHSAAAGDCAGFRASPVALPLSTCDKAIRQVCAGRMEEGQGKRGGKERGGEKWERRLGKGKGDLMCVD